jgi:hypothetical protein
MTNLTWVMYSLAAVTGGLLAAALLNRIRNHQEGRNRRLSRMLAAAGALTLLLAYFNVFGEPSLAASAGALLCFVAAARLSTLNRHQAAAN